MRFIFFACLFSALQSGAQWKSFSLSPRGDTLNRIDANGVKQGPWINKVAPLRGEKGYEEQGWYKNGLKEGKWQAFSPEGDLLSVEGYSFGYKNGKSVYFNRIGDPLREESWRAIDPKNPYDTVNVYDVNDPSKIVKRQIVKIEPNSYKHGTWRYYDANSGAVVKTEQWVMDKLKTPEAAGDDDLAPIDVADGNTAKKEVKKEVPKPKEVLQYEKKNSGKKTIKVRTGQTGG
jgi:antitoxin component YwqK of YwqJK toxin-antitoxin module